MVVAPAGTAPVHSSAALSATTVADLQDLTVPNAIVAPTSPP
ncbi:hypothetical protein [Isoptericola jiangsuensis]|nr:hypothetical protein [Isoptericola jiangsuensis]